MASAPSSPSSPRDLWWQALTETFSGNARCKVKRLSIAFSVERRHFIHSHAADGIFGHHDYFLDSLAITTTSRTATATPITAQSHIPPPVRPPIHSLGWFITKDLWLRCDQPPTGNPDRERKQRVSRKATWPPVHQPSNLCDCSVRTIRFHNPGSPAIHPCIPETP